MILNKDSEQFKKNQINKFNNIKNLRIFLKMTQKEFISSFLLDKDGKSKISISTLSNLENKGGIIVDDVICDLSRSLNINHLVFTFDQDDFLDMIENQYRLGNNAFCLEKSKKKDSLPNLVNRLILHFADEIIEGKIKKGDQIESDRELAKRMNVGRSALREALKVLQVMGMIDIRPGQGSYISKETTNFFEVPLAWSLFMNDKQIYDILQVRIMLEEKAAELASFSVNKEKLAKLDRIMADIEKAYNEEDIHTFLELDLEFHITIAEASGNSVILLQILTIQNLLKRISRTGMQSKEDVEKIYHEHLDVYKYIKSGKGDHARASMKSHMERSFARYKTD